ncbi:MAG: 16S rRNA (guanine(527)-N(7))-methyltransferase RsmG, partial [Lachnospiraceae bacterium]|nr:16S rRNA (guanine(527)-N(7))-methyltransferase RsmG [Lachnospiraceae bacterium]
FISFKGDLQNELSDAGFAITRLGGDSKNVSVKTFSIPGVADNRSLIYITKEKNTPREFPRKAGIPAKSPLSLL